MNDKEAYLGLYGWSLTLCVKHYSDRQPRFLQQEIEEIYKPIYDFALQDFYEREPIHNKLFNKKDGK